MLQVLAYLCEQNEQARVDICATNVLDQALQMLRDSDLVTQKYVPLFQICIFNYSACKLLGKTASLKNANELKEQGPHHGNVQKKWESFR